jgi:hypothetical protein
MPTVAPPALVRPEDQSVFRGQTASIELVWRSSHTLKPDECYVIVLRWTEGGAPASERRCIQATSWFVDSQLYLRADQETERLYQWSVSLARKQTDPEDGEQFVPFSPSSEEWLFFWK